jgi:4-amino-4-deoxy-L-arabinose transferase-like glycosyltransferase
MWQSLLKGRLWFLLLGVTLATILASSIYWMVDHPYAIHWDEADYFNHVLRDQSCLNDRGLRALRFDMLYRDRSRPPAYRVLSFPFFCLFGFSSLTARLVSLGFLWLSLGLIYLAVRKVTSPPCAIVTVLLICLSPEILCADVAFGTEFPLLLAVSGTFYFLISAVSSKAYSAKNWIGLGLSIGLGFLSKASFLAVAFPVLGFLFVAGRIRALSGPPPSFALKAGVLGALVAAPWWWVNAEPVLDYSHYVRDYVRHSLGAPSVSTWASWLLSVFQCLLGYGSTLVITLIAAAWLGGRISRRDVGLDPVQRTIVLACACVALPLIVIQLSGSNHLLRHLAPAVIAIAVAAGLLAHVTGCLRSRFFVTASGVALFAQLLMVAVPAFHPNASEVVTGPINGFPPWRVMTRHDQWNWQPLCDISREHGLARPVVSVLGNGRSFNIPQITYAWIAGGAPEPQVDLLWRYEEGPIDWPKVMETVGRSDIVVTAPRYVGITQDAQDRDNQHNAEISDRLTQDRRFEGPICLRMGRFDPVEVAVFVKRR